MDIKEFRTQYPSYDHVGDEELAKVLHKKYYGHVPYGDFAGKFLGKKPSTSVMEDVKIGLADATNSVDTAITLAGRGLEKLVGRERTIEDEDLLFKNMQERNAARAKWANPDNAEQGFGGKILGTALTLPAQIPAMIGSAPTRMTDLIDKGEDIGTARRAGIGDAVLNMGALALPGVSQLGKMRGAFAGAAGNVVAGGASDAYTNYLAQRQETKDAYKLNDWEKRAQEAIIGGGFGYAGSKNLPKGPTKAATETRSKAEEIATRKREQALAADKAVVRQELGAPQGELPLGKVDIPPELAGVDESGVINPYDVGGQVTRGEPQLDMFAKEADMAKAASLESELNPTTMHPSLLSAEQGDVGQPLGTGRNLMDNGKLSTGMHPDVPTIDFPLRQEVLERPEIKQAVENFRLEDAANGKAIAKKNAEIDQQIKFMDEYAGSKEAMQLEHQAMEKLTGELDLLQQKRDALREEFGRGMEQLGIRNSSEAHGLQRALYEATNKGIPVKRTFDPRKPINSKGLGGKERGAIDPEVFREGFRDLAKPYSELTEKDWVKARFPSSHYHTNSDRTPLLMNHATTKDFSGMATVTGQGLHLGFLTPNHLITGGQSGGNYTFKRTGAAAGARHFPMAIRKGNYEYIDRDFGDWSPRYLLEDSSFIDTVNEWAFKAGKDVSVDGEAKRALQLLDRVDDVLRQAEGTNEYGPLVKQAQETRSAIMSSFLRRTAGVDGIFYRNNVESVHAQAIGDNSPRGKVLSRKSKPAISLVVYDPTMVESLYHPRKAGDLPEENPVGKRMAKKWNKEAGAIDPELLYNMATGGVYGIVKKINKEGDLGKLTSPVTDEYHRNAAYQMATGADEYIARGPSVEEAVNLIKNEPDLNSSNNALVGGAEMFAAIKNSTAVAALKLWPRAARKLAELKDRESIMPVEKQFRQLFRNKEAEKLAEVFKVESREGIRFEESELREMGLSPDQVTSYTGLRNLFDEAYELQKSKMTPEEAKHFTKQDAYLASQWRGDWGAPIYDAKGKLVWWIRETSKARADNAIKRVLDSDPTLRADKVEYKKSFMAGNEATLIQSYSKLVEILGKDDPMVQQIAEVVKDYYVEEGAQTQGQKKHFKPKAGVRGFEGDRLDRSAKQNAEDLFNAQFAYLRSAFEWGHMQDAMGKVSEILKNPELQESHSNTLNWMREDIRNIMGFGTMAEIRNLENLASKGMAQVFAPVDSTISKFFPNYKGMPTDVSSMRSGIGTLKMGFYNMTLGFMNVPFMITNMLQPGFAIPHMIELNNSGYKANALRSMAEGAAMTGSAGMYHYYISKGDTKAAQKVLDSIPEDSREAIKYIEANGIVELNQFSEVGKLSQSATGEFINQTVGWSIQKPEFVARTATFMMFVSHLRQAGMTDAAEIHRLAEDRTNMVMGNYKHFERAGIFNKTGLIGNSAGTLQTFAFNQYNQLYNFSKRFAKDRSMKTLAPLAAMTAYQFMLGGAMGFYGVDTADKLWNWLRELGAEYGWFSPAATSFNLKKYMLDNLPQVMSYGGLSKATGLNFSSRMDAGTIPGFGDNQLMPFLSFYSGAMDKAVGLLSSPSETTRDKFLMQVAPSSVKGALEAQLPTYGADYARNMKNPGTNPIYRRNEEDKSARSWNMQTMDEASARTREYASKSTDAIRSKSQNRVAEKVVNAIRLGTPEKMDELIVEYAQLGGDVPALIRTLDNRLAQRYITKMEALGRRAKSPGAVYKYLERGGQANVPGSELPTR